jgi:hypothetical protein
MLAVFSEDAKKALPEETGAAGYQNLHGHLPSFRLCLSTATPENVTR